MRIAKVLFYLTLSDPPTHFVTNIYFIATYDVLHNTTSPNVYVKYELCRKCKQSEIVEHGLHKSCLLKTPLT